MPTCFVAHSFQVFREMRKQHGGAGGAGTLPQTSLIARELRSVYSHPCPAVPAEWREPLRLCVHCWLTPLTSGHCARLAGQGLPLSTRAGPLTALPREGWHCPRAQVGPRRHR